MSWTQDIIGELRGDYMRQMARSAHQVVVELGCQIERTAAYVFPKFFQALHCVTI